MMSIGMPYDLFWFGDMDAVDIYISAYKKSLERQRQEVNWQCWVNNYYNRIAITSAFSQEVKYPEKPLEFKNKEKDKELIDDGTESAILALNKFIENRNARALNG